MNNSLPDKCPNCERLERRVEELEAQARQLAELVNKLRAELEEAHRSGKRQAAPFRKKKKANPKKPGRKKGDAHGGHAHRESIPEEQLDAIYDAPLPAECPCCGGHQIYEQEVAYQYQTEIPRRPIYRRFDVHIGECLECGAHLQGRHELQISDALGAAASQLGANAHSALSLLNKEMGLSHGKCAAVFQRLFGIKIARSTSVRSMLRSAARLQPAYQQIREVARASPVNTPDDTGWRVGGENHWLHVTVSATVTCYVIAKSRGHEILASVLGKGYTGILVRDGFLAYNCFRQAIHQLCLAHLLRRCEKLLESASRGAVRFPRQVKAILQKALLLRDRHKAGEISRRGLWVMRGRLTEQLRRLVRPVKTHSGNERFAAHLEAHLDHLFTFLKYPGLDATNWRAEQAIRPAVVNRKVWGGNRTQAGANAQETLMSVIVTCHQNDIDPLDFISHALTATKPVVIFSQPR
jgi:transposase